MNYDDPTKRKRMAKKLQKVEVIGTVENAAAAAAKDSVVKDAPEKSTKISGDATKGVKRKSMDAEAGGGKVAGHSEKVSSAAMAPSFQPPKPVSQSLKLDRDDLDDMLPAIAPEYKPLNKL